MAVKPDCPFCNQRMDRKALDDGLRWCTACTRSCRTCGREKGDHTVCRVCGDPLGHGHDPEYIGLEWEGRARMAAAKRAAGSILDDIDREALDRFPHPRRLTLGGYR